MTTNAVGPCDLKMNGHPTGTFAHPEPTLLSDSIHDFDSLPLKSHELLSELNVTSLASSTMEVSTFVHQAAVLMKPFCRPTQFGVWHFGLLAMLIQPFGDSRGPLQSHIEAQTGDAIPGM